MYGKHSVPQFNFGQCIVIQKYYSEYTASQKFPITFIMPFKQHYIREIFSQYANEGSCENGNLPVPLLLMSRGVLHSQSSLPSVMGSNDTCRTLRHYNEPEAVKLKGVDTLLDTDQCLFLQLGNDKCHGHTGAGNEDPHTSSFA